MRTKTGRLIAVLVVSLTAIVSSAVLAATAPADWKVLVDKAKTCQISVPPDWIVDSSSQRASPDRKMGVWFEGTDRGQTLAAAKARMKYDMRSSIQIFEDSKKRLWFSYKDTSGPEGSRETIFFVAIPVNGNACSARIYFENSRLKSVAKQIAESIGPVK